MDYELFKRALIECGMDFWNAPEGKVITIEPKILPLVAVLNYCGYNTRQSCEGHPLAIHKERALRHQERFPNQPLTITYEDEHTLEYEIDKSQLPLPYAGAKKWTFKFDETPWVMLDMPSPDKQRRLEEVVRQYNVGSNIEWYLRQGGSAGEEYEELSIRPQYSLEQMHNDIEIFTEFLYRNMLE